MALEEMVPEEGQADVPQLWRQKLNLPAHHHAAAAARSLVSSSVG